MAPRIPFSGLEHWKCFAPGHWLDLEEPAGRVQHAFCGVHEIRGAWCPFGDHPLLRLVSLDTADARLGLGDLGLELLHLLYCWRCDVGDLDYRLDHDGNVTVLGEPEWIESLRQTGLDPETVRARLRDPDTAFPYRNYPAAFPLRAATLRALGPDQDAIVAAERHPEAALPEAFNRPHHQAGGLPYLTQGSSHVPTCAGCGDAMTFVASIADDCGDPRGFTSNAWVQVVFFFCPACRRVRAGNMCD